ncbi:hypothetical protein AVEN_179181-1 [Araneus ventricosus]|uniref:Reverse transcriptase domain-containing protein n=1 Tax=Araneus ventricosus TaxID=182803 RepID=A0A4Y2C7N2_ARAVE|nr:hypothetical protein AVEN_179181-1 [Araneus ventricosus]
MASKRLDNLWKRLNRDPAMKFIYSEFLREYKNLNHMEEITNCNYSNGGYFLLHQGVLRPFSITTKLRVVFDASAKTTTGHSLNDLLCAGGVLQDDLFSILTRFRKHQYAFTADISKMFRQIEINPSQRKYLKILWKEGPEENVQVFALKTVTYGTTSAPFLATRTLQQLAKDERENFPIASKVLLEDFYMDDCLSGASDINQFMALKKELGELLLRGGMTLHKCLSSSSSESDLYPFNYCEKQSTVKTLGMMWNNCEDSFLFDISTSSTTESTKRDVLSQTARLFDPLGLLGPVISKTKIFFQRLWLLQIDCCQKLPSDIAQEWSSFTASLSHVKNIKISRFALRPNPKEIILHGFSDASEKAYGAVIYLQSACDSSDNNTFLLCSKSRVVPIKNVTIPRLELAAQLTRKVLNALKLKIDQVLLWTDSTIALSWIDTPPHLLKTFVSNRVSQIQELTKEYHWAHITSKNNPANLLSRGIDAQFLVNNQFWFQVPDSFNSLDEL